jgi:hypothetical protein
VSWYVRRGASELGPLGTDALRALVGTGQITADTPLWREGLRGWTAAAGLPGVLGPRGAATLPPATSAPGHAPPRKPATPWRRYWARALDIAVSTFLVAALISAIRPGLIPQSNAVIGQKWLLMLWLLPFALLMDTLLYWALGNTPGKAIAGIKVLDERGRTRLGARAYLGRNFGVYVFGLGLGLPLIGLITLIVTYRRAAAAQPSSWDRFAGSRVYALAGAKLRTWVVAGIYLLGLAGLFAFDAQARHYDSRYAAARTPAAILRQELTQAANGVNATAPKMIDHVTRLDGARVGPGALFTYEYTVTNLRVSLLSPAGLAAFRRRLSVSVQQAVCREGELTPLLRAGTTVRFHYHDRVGKDLATVSVSSAICAR